MGDGHTRRSIVNIGAAGRGIPAEPIGRIIAVSRKRQPHQRSTSAIGQLRPRKTIRVPYFVHQNARHVAEIGSRLVDWRAGLNQFHAVAAIVQFAAIGTEKPRRDGAVRIQKSAQCVGVGHRVEADDEHRLACRQSRIRGKNIIHRVSQPPCVGGRRRIEQLHRSAADIAQFDEFLDYVVAAVRKVRRMILNLADHDRPDFGDGIGASGSAAKLLDCRRRVCAKSPTGQRHENRALAADDP